MSYPAVYIIFIGGAADKDAFVWQNIKLPFRERFTHHSVGALANFFANAVTSQLQTLTDDQQLSAYPAYKIDYLGYHEVFFEELQNIIPQQTVIPSPTCERYKYIKDSIGDNTQVYIVGHSLGGWNGAHLSYILSQLGVEVGCLITLDPVGTGNHEVPLINPLIKKAQIYTADPIPVAKQWFNIQARHIDVASKQGSWRFEDWVAWAGGQWLITNDYPTVQQRVCEKVNLSHKSVFKMFTHQTKSGQSPYEYLLDSTMKILKS